MKIPSLGDVLGNIASVTMSGVPVVATVPVVGPALGGAAVASVLVNEFTDDTDRRDAERAAAAREAQEQRDHLWGERDRVASTVADLDYSEHVLGEDDPFDAMSHAEIVEHVNAIDPGYLGDVKAAWQSFGTAIEASLSQFQGAVATSITEGWQGRGGSAAAAAVVDYARNGGDLCARVALVSNKIDEASTALDEVKRSMPPADKPEWWKSLIDNVPGPTFKQAAHESEEAERQARQVMKDVYMPQLRRADDQVPILPAAFDPTAAAGGEVPSSPGGSGHSPGGGGYSPGGGQTYNQTPGGGFGGSSWPTDARAGDDASSGADARPDPSAVGPGTSVDGSGENPGRQGSYAGGSPASASVEPAGTVAASALPQTGDAAQRSGGVGGAGVGGSPSTAAFGPGAGASGTGSGASGGGAGGFVGPGGPAVGARGQLPGATAGVPGGAFGGGAPAGQSGAAGAGRSTMMGGMGGMAPGRGAGGSEDDVHETPGYLVTMDNSNELIGDLPMVSPPVLGE
ncbi:hypothetical protein ABH922_003486 [Rhodococcus sp. 27YEA15]|uniref:hypothetical protein n=1 Tax=Rhodococcus sp. 27YEA15 TaxID=3156259 RepID=UPI003C79F3C1